MKTALRITAILIVMATLTCSVACTESPSLTDTSTEFPTDASELPSSPTEKPTEKDPPPAVAPQAELVPHSNTVSFTKPAIPATVGKELDLSLYSVQFQPDSTPRSAEQLEWSSEQIAIVDNKITLDQKGVYTLKASDGKNEKNIYLIVKGVFDEEYILYYNDFETAETAPDISEIFSKGNASYEIEDGRLLLDASASANDSIGVLLPSWLSDFGDYTITSHATVTKKANDSRWMSIMYRVQNNGHPYYQLCLRSNTSSSNGVELAYNNPSSSWEYQTKTSYTENFSSDKLYEISLTVYGENADIYIDGNTVGGGFGIDDFSTGAVGMQANGCAAVFDDIKITVDFTAQGTAALAPTIISRVNNEDDLDNLFVDPPEIAILTLDPDGNVIDKSASAICTLDEATRSIPEGVILAAELPGTYNYDVSAMAALLRHTERSDVMVISDNTDLLKQLRESVNTLLCVVDFTDYDLNHGLIEARSIANSAGARICLLSNDLAEQTTTEFFNTLNMTVWYESKDNSVVDAFRLITSGANGIIAKDRELLRSCLASSVFAENSILRPVSVIGHRGMPSQAPENTIAGSALAATYGANVIENDIYITTDGVIVVMHDSTLDRTTTGKGNIESYTYKELCQFFVSDSPDSSSSLDGRVETRQPIPTLEEYLQEFEDTDTFLFIEIKSSKTNVLVPALKELLDEYDFYDQACVIGFSQEAIRAVKKTIPELSVGLLCSTGKLNTIMKDTSHCTSSYNPSSSYVSASLVRYLATRGIFTWPWTVNDSDAFDSLYLMGVAGITTNFSNFAENYAKRLHTEKSKYSFKAGETAQIGITVERFGMAKGGVLYENNIMPTNKAEMFIIEGNATLRFDGTSVTADAVGDATVIFRLPFRLSNGATAYIYTQPVYINVT